MEIITSLIVLLYGSTIALGVGSSTLAISSFIIAQKDGEIDPSERRMLGVTYTVLRIAMVLILLSVVYLSFAKPEIIGTQAPYIFTLIGVLYANALMMTYLKRARRFAPALQAATWYTLGFVVNINMFGLFLLTTGEFVLLYAVDIVIAVILLNGWLAYQKRQLLPSA